MTDEFSPLSISRLYQWIQNEYQQQEQIFGIHRELFFQPNAADAFRLSRYGQRLETPIGVAAGPHTQLAPNIIAAWLCGARYIELKTVQTLDQLTISRPCIDLTDEGYNCEWSQELHLDQSFDEYLNAWIMIHILHRQLGWPGECPGVIFNMSVGYDLAGIRKPNVQRFLDRMTYCADAKTAKIEELSALDPDLAHGAIPDRVSDNVTISTMHGCPPAEIEQIARYFIEERGLHTAVKLNPTLLGPERLRHILNDRLGYPIHVPDAAFAHDISYDSAVTMIESLRDCARKAGVSFGLKLTNTLETRNSGRALPSAESMVYMSGRALHPLSIQVAAQLQQDFDGTLDLSFCGGVDAFNVVDVLTCGLEPVTVCSDLLKPGGYTRLAQYITHLRDANIDWPIPPDTALANLQKYAQKTVSDLRYRQAAFPYDHIKTPRPLTAFDCVQAPCVTACAISQNVPGYMFHTARGDDQAAWETIRADNSLPNTTGLVCDHRCQTKCTRLNLDNPLLIREIKRYIAEHAEPQTPNPNRESRTPKIAIIGAGPSGLVCADFLSRAGCRVTIYEAKGVAGGMATDAIPTFRLDEKRVQADIQNLLKGQNLEKGGDSPVTIHYHAKIDSAQFEKIRAESDYVYIAVGAQRSKKLGLAGEDTPGVTDQLHFLAAVRRGESLDLGRRVAIVGGGNSCMDAARTAHRLVGDKGEVFVIYRRTRHEMPADPHEVEALMAEGIQVHELTAPEALHIENQRVKSLVCARMELGSPDESGRPRPVKIDASEFEIAVDTVISAIGQEVVLDFFPEPTLSVDPRRGETQLPNVFAGGDAVRGAATLIQAMGDGKRVAQTILARIAAAEASDKQDFSLSVDMTDRETSEETPLSFRTDVRNLPTSEKRDFPLPVDMTDGEKSEETPLSFRTDVRNLTLREHQQRLAWREYGRELPTIPPNQRLNFNLVHPGLSDADARREASRCLQCDQICNICVSVCPNRANIAFTIEPITIPRYRVTFSAGRPSATKIESSQTYRQRPQIINIDDFCNECGNCTTFCPTNGAPFQTKPNFHLTRATFDVVRDGYYLGDDTLLAWYDGQQHELHLDDAVLIYRTNAIQATFDATDFHLITCQCDNPDLLEFDFKHVPEMIVLLMNLRRLHPFG